MAHAHESNTKRIWIVFGILSVITIVEVLFGIYKPKSLYFNNF
jgi:cytochrome c oxidase subunit 4